MFIMRKTRNKQELKYPIILLAILSWSGQHKNLPTQAIMLNGMFVKYMENK